MSVGHEDPDRQAIAALIASQFDSLQWRPGSETSWSRFVHGFVDGALLFPAARPLAPKTVGEFVQRMDSLRASGALKSFEETKLGHVIHVFGNVAMAMAACEMRENEQTVTRDVSVFLFVKDNAQWRIAAQAWDVVPDGQAIPAHLSLRNGRSDEARWKQGV